MFGKIEDIKTQNYVIGIRVFGSDKILEQWKKEGDYYLVEAEGPDKVPIIIADLISKGIKIREVKEMQNPLEELFK